MELNDLYSLKKNVKNKYRIFSVFVSHKFQMKNCLKIN